LGLFFQLKLNFSSFSTLFHLFFSLFWLFFFKLTTNERELTPANSHSSLIIYLGFGLPAKAGKLALIGFVFSPPRPTKISVNHC